MTSNGKRKSGRAADGEVRADAVYTLDDFRRRTGLGESSMRHARREGLPVRYFGNRGFILGRDWLDFLDALETTAPGPKAGDAID